MGGRPFSRFTIRSRVITTTNRSPSNFAFFKKEMCPMCRKSNVPNTSTVFISWLVLRVSCLVTDGLHERKQHAISHRFILKKREQPFRDAETARWRHAVLQRFDKILVVHLCFRIPLLTQLRLLFESLGLINRVIQFRIPVPQLAPRYDHLEAFRKLRSVFLALRKRRRHDRHVYQKSRFGNAFSAVLPKRIGEAAF